jgi:transposase
MAAILGLDKNSGCKLFRSARIESRAIKVSTDLVRRFDVIAVEDLKIRGMIWNRCFAQAICVWLGGLFHDDEWQS